MENDYDMELYRLIGKISKPDQDEVFVERVSGRIARHRFTCRVMHILLAFAGVVILAVLTPWLITLTGRIAMGINLLAQSAAILLSSPIGWSIGGGGLGLYFIFKRVFLGGSRFSI
jgi:hypothetical protein